MPARSTGRSLPVGPRTPRSRPCERARTVREPLSAALSSQAYETVDGFGLTLTVCMQEPEKCLLVLQLRQVCDGIRLKIRGILCKCGLDAVVTVLQCYSCPPTLLKVEDYYPSGKRFLLWFNEKGGKEKELPVHHKLEELLDEYLKSKQPA
jgi:hypothetical protein